MGIRGNSHDAFHHDLPLMPSPKYYIGEIMIVHMTQDFINSRLICPEGRSKIEFVADDRSGLYILVKANKPGEGTYYLRYKNAENKTCHINLGKTKTDTLSEIKAKLIQAKAEIEKGVVLDKKEPTLKEYFDDTYLPYCKIRNRNWISKERLFKLRIEDEFGDKRLSEITYLQLQTYHSNLKKSGLKGATCDHPIKLLSHLFNMCIQEELLTENPAARVKQYREYNEVQNTLSDKQLKDLLSVLENSGTQPALIAMMLIATGCRLNEILTATWDNVDLENNTLRIPSASSKNKRDRHLPLNEAAVSVINKLTTKGKYQHLFINPRTEKPYSDIHKAWDKLRIQAGVPKLRIHDLRHFYASNMASNGISIYVISKLLGHRDVVTTQRYSHVSDEALKNAANTVSESINAALEKAS